LTSCSAARSSSNVRRTSGRYGATSEYARDLIRRDQDRQNLRDLLLAGVAFEPGPVAGRQHFDELRTEVDPPPVDDLHRVIPCRLASQDLRDAVAHYAGEVDAATTRQFIDAVEQAFTLIARQPAMAPPATPSSSTCRGCERDPSNSSAT
jgi:hypothetical protein